jgi:hypothetical protein
VTTADRLRKELVALTHQHGLLDGGAPPKFGDDLVTVFGGPEPDPSKARERAVGTIERLLTGFSDEDKLILRAAFGFGGAVTDRKLTARVEALAGRLAVSERTIRRRVDDLIRRLAALMAAVEREHTPAPAAGWHVRRLAALLRLDTDGPCLYEDRIIRSLRDDLQDTEVRFGLPADEGAAPPHLDVLQGASLRGADLSATHYLYRLGLPQPLRRHEEHRFRVALSLPPGRRIRPHYVFQPLVPCDRFDLCVRFDPTHPPARVWEVRGITLRQLEEEPPVPSAVLTPDGVGEVERAFTGMQAGLTYGVAWRWQ